MSFLIAKLREQAKEVQTIGSAVTSLKNEFTIYIGELDRSTGASRAVTQAILGLSENLDVVTRAAGGFWRFIPPEGAGTCHIGWSTYSGNHCPSPCFCRGA